MAGDIGKLAAIAALSMGMSMGGWDDPAPYRAATGPSLPPAPPKPLTKRQKRRLRGKAKVHP